MSRPRSLEAARQIEQEARPVEGVHLDHGLIGRGRVVEDHVRRHGEGAGLRLHTLAHGLQDIDGALSREDIADDARDFLPALDLLLIGENPVEEQRIEHQAIARRRNLR